MRTSVDGAVQGPSHQLQLIQRHLHRQSQEEEEDLAEVTIYFRMYGSEVDRCIGSISRRTLQGGEMVMTQASKL